MFVENGPKIGGKQFVGTENRVRIRVWVVLIPCDGLEGLDGLGTDAPSRAYAVVGDDAAFGGGEGECWGGCVNGFSGLGIVVEDGLVAEVGDGLPLEAEEGGIGIGVGSEVGEEVVECVVGLGVGVVVVDEVVDDVGGVHAGVVGGE